MFYTHVFLTYPPRQMFGSNIHVCSIIALWFFCFCFLGSFNWLCCTMWPSSRKLILPPDLFFSFNRRRRMLICFVTVFLKYEHNASLCLSQPMYRDAHHITRFSPTQCSSCRPCFTRLKITPIKWFKWGIVPFGTTDRMMSVFFHINNISDNIWMTQGCLDLQLHSQLS